MSSAYETAFKFAAQADDVNGAFYVVERVRGRITAETLVQPQHFGGSQMNIALEDRGLYHKSCHFPSAKIGVAVYRHMPLKGKNSMLRSLLRSWFAIAAPLSLFTGVLSANNITICKTTGSASLIGQSFTFNVTDATGRVLAGSPVSLTANGPCTTFLNVLTNGASPFTIAEGATTGSILSAVTVTATTYTSDLNARTVTVDIEGGTETTVTFVNSASPPVGKGEAATIGFWRNKNGQAVINSFNTGPTATLLGNWLATNFPKLFGVANPYTGTNLAGLTNAEAATVYSNLSTSGVTANTYLQAFAVALGCYASTTSLGGQSLINNGLAAKYGFKVTAGGLCNATYNVGNNGAAFAVPNDTTLTVFQVMVIANANFDPATGLFYGGDPTLTSDLNNVLDGINSTGDIS